MFKRTQRYERREDNNGPRVNMAIRIPQIRVVKEDEQLGVMSPDQARQIAFDLGLDLVEIAPQAKPPVCRIMDYSKYKYEQKIKEKDKAKKARESQTQFKEIWLSPRIDDHDIDMKINLAKRILSEGNKVQFNLRFKNRELAHKDRGFVIIQRVMDSLKDESIIDKYPKLEGNRILCSLSPIKNKS